MWTFSPPRIRPLFVWHQHADTPREDDVKGVSVIPELEHKLTGLVGLEVQIPAQAALLVRLQLREELDALDEG